MAYQHADNRKGAQINRTPAPDEVTQIRAPRGGNGYGQNTPQPSSVPPGKAVESILATNLRESQADAEDVLSQIIAKGVAGRGDEIPADGSLQQRAISAQSYPLAHGMKRQQMDYHKIGVRDLPAKQTDNETEPERQQG